MAGGFELGNDGPMIIVVGVDGSPTSLRATAYAAGQARRQRARLVMVFVGRSSLMANLAPPEAMVDLAESLDQQSEELGRNLIEAARSSGVDAEYRALRGDPYLELTRVAAELRADAVIVGASTQAGHRLVGSLAVRLVKAGKWPVTVVP